MNTKRALVLGLIAGGFYIAACGSTNSSVGDTGPSAGSSGKPDSNGTAGASSAGASSVGASGHDGASGASPIGTGGSVGLSGASSAGATDPGNGGSANHAGSGGGANHAGSGGGANHAGSGGGPDCSGIACAAADNDCGVNQVPTPAGQCCPLCLCPQACPASAAVACAQGITPIPAPTNPKVCCPQPSCPDAVCVGKQCGDECPGGEFGAQCNLSGKCVLGGTAGCP